MIYYKGGLTFTWELGSLKSGCVQVQAYILRINKTIFFSSVEGPLLHGGHKSCIKRCCGLGKLPICQIQHFRKYILNVHCGNRIPTTEFRN